MAIKYDPRIIEQFADGLYWRASQIVRNSTIVGGLVGAALGGGCSAGFYVVWFKGVNGNAVAVAASIAGLLGAYQGYLSGSARAFVLRLEAQRALCAVQTERNTRRTAEATEALVPPPAPAKVAIEKEEAPA